MTSKKVSKIKDYVDGRIEHARDYHVGEGWDQVIRELEAVREMLNSL